LVEQQADLARRRDTAIQVLSSLGFPAIHPDAAPFLLFDIRRTGLTSDQFAQETMRNARVVLAPGSAFGSTSEGYMRAALVEPAETLGPALKRLANVTAGARS
jgi:aminotransferase